MEKYDYLYTQRPDRWNLEYVQEMDGTGWELVSIFPGDMMAVYPATFPKPYYCWIWKKAK
jgi:hypothetical protein